MPSFFKNLKNLVFNSIAEGDVTKANEITANLLLGFVAFLMAIFMILALIANEFGIFTADIQLMREAAIVTVIISVILFVINRIFYGEKKWLKYILIIGFILECGAMLCVLGHNVTLVAVIPVILSIRYFDRKFSIITAVISAVAFLIATFVCAYIGIININVLPVEQGTVLNVTDTLRAAINTLDIDRTAYTESYLLNDFAPRALVFIMISIICCFIAKRGKQMIDLQNDVTKKTSRIETELNLATEIQANMLPCALPAFPDHEQIELYARNIPAKEVGGDFYDYFRVDNNHVAVVMADVSGKGVGAALFMMISKTVIKNQLMLGLDPATAMTNANAQLCENNTAGLFVTAWVAVYEVSTGILRYVNAGHNPPIIKKKNQEAYYHKGKTGFVLAGMDGVKYKQLEMELHPGDEIFLYTDGLTEAENRRRELYGEDRLLECLERINKEIVTQQVDDVLADIAEFVDGAAQFDDMTMLGMKVHENPYKQH